MVSQMLDYRFQPEDYWIKTLQNECPYGLNQNLCALINSQVKCSHHFLVIEKDIWQLENAPFIIKIIYTKTSIIVNSNFSLMLKLVQINIKD